MSILEIQCTEMEFEINFNSIPVPNSHMQLKTFSVEKIFIILNRAYLYCLGFIMNMYGLKTFELAPFYM